MLQPEDLDGGTNPQLSTFVGRCARADAESPLPHVGAGGGALSSTNAGGTPAAGLQGASSFSFDDRQQLLSLRPRRRRGHHLRSPRSRRAPQRRRVLSLRSKNAWRPPPKRFPQLLRPRRLRPGPATNSRTPLPRAPLRRLLPPASLPPTRSSAQAVLATLLLLRRAPPPSQRRR